MKTKIINNKKYIYIISASVLIITSMIAGKYLYNKYTVRLVSMTPMSAEEIKKLDNREYEVLGLDLYNIKLENNLDNFAKTIYSNPKITSSYGADTFKIGGKEIIIKNSYETLNDTDSKYGVEYLVNSKRVKFDEYASQYMGSAEIDSRPEKQFFVILGSGGSMEDAGISIIYMNGDKLLISDSIYFPYKGGESEFESIFFKNKVFKNKNGQIIFTGNHSPYVSIIFGNNSIKSIEVPALFTLDRKENKIIKYTPTNPEEILAINNFYKKMSEQVSEKLIAIANSKLSEESLYMTTVNILARQYQLNTLSGIIKDEALEKVSIGAKRVYPVDKFGEKYKDVKKKIEDSLVNSKL